MIEPEKLRREIEQIYKMGYRAGARKYAQPGRAVAFLLSDEEQKQVQQAVDDLIKMVNPQFASGFF